MDGSCQSPKDAWHERYMAEPGKNTTRSGERINEGDLLIQGEERHLYAAQVRDLLGKICCPHGAHAVATVHSVVVYKQRVGYGLVDLSEV